LPSKQAGQEADRKENRGQDKAWNSSSIKQDEKAIEKNP
jgi:hypothetical protein